MDHWNVVNLNFVCAVVTPTGDFLLILLVPFAIGVGLAINTVGGSLPDAWFSLLKKLRT